MTVGKKLYLGFGAALVITLVMGIVSLFNLSTLGESIDNLANISSRNLYLAGDLNDSTTDYLARVRGMNLRAHMNNPDKVREMYEESQKAAERIRKDAEEFATRTTHADLREKLHSQVLDKLGILTQATTEDYELLQKGQLQAADAITQERVLPLADAMSDVGESIAGQQYKIIQARGAAGIAAIGPARMISIVMMLLSIAIGGGVVVVVRSIVEVLRSSVIELREGAEQVANAASQVSSSSQSLAQGSSEQAASLEETSASSEEINSMARKNTDNSRDTANLLSRSNEKVDQANRHLQEMVVSMNLITDSSGKISKIIKVIDEIAFQTNILALNAAVEAARAGEAGMGFAVVADEVRSLAQRSAQAAKDTAVLIEDSIRRADEGKLKVDQVAEAIQEVTQDSGRVKVMVDEVSLGSEEQSKGIDQIGRAISQMEQVTQTIAANAEESAAAAEELSAQSEALKDVVGRLHTMVDGDGESHAARPSARRSAPATIRPTFKPATFVKKPVTMSSKPSFSSAPVTKKKSDMDEFPLEDSFQTF
jgi:methyl-accepting chemotaxis protein